MLTALRVLIVVLCLVAGGFIAVATLESGDDDRDKASLIDQVVAGLQTRGAVPRFTGCYARQLDRRLTDEEVKGAYRSSPRRTGDAGTLDAQRFITPATIRPFNESGLACARRLVASGHYTRRQVLRKLRRWKPPGL